MSVLRSLMKRRRLFRSAAALGIGGALLSGSCSSDQISAILAGVETVASRLDRSYNNNLDFGEWLATGLERL